MSEQINTAETGVTTPGTDDKMFTQEDVNRIVGKRLAEERAKAEPTLAQREQELAQREFLFNAKEILTGKGLPVSLLDAMNTSSPEAFDKSLAVIEEQFKQHQGPVRTQLPHQGAPNVSQDSQLRRVMGLK